MTRKMLIDASQPEETRVVVMQGGRIEDFNYDFEAKKQLKGNVYLAKITRVEPSLQAAFVDYGGNRHGFLAFNEIHPDYYKIPIADREKLIEEETVAEESGEEPEEGESVETVGGDDLEDEEKRRGKLRRRYKIQEVIKRGQIILIQVVKEERGNKGAALTTYLSLPGRYCVLMPNTARGGGVSRKITNQKDRKRLKSVLDEFGIPGGMTVIVRTAGSERTKLEIKRDYSYLIRLWDTIRNDTLNLIAPALIYEEANLIKRAIRDLYSKDIDEVYVEGDEGYRIAKDMMKTLMPSHAKKVQPYKDGGTPLFHHFQVEGQLDSINSPVVQLRSGGSIVLHQTEALVAIDVNSGRATRERHIEETALRTNLEAAEEVSRQLRLRDLAGLIVIDFIDMEENRNNHSVERRLKDSLRADRARIQVGRISHFGLLEMSRQRLRPSLMEISSEICSHCGGTGLIRSTEWAALYTLRAVEEEAIKGNSAAITVTVHRETALYILNNKRDALASIETRYGLSVTINSSDNLAGETCQIVSADGGKRAPLARETVAPTTVDNTADNSSDVDANKRRRPRRRRNRNEESDSVDSHTPVAEDAGGEDEDVSVQEVNGAKETSDDDKDSQPKRRRRGRRGGRRRGRKEATDASEALETGTAGTGGAETGDAGTGDAETGDTGATEAQTDSEQVSAEDSAEPKKIRRPRQRRGRRPANPEEVVSEAVHAADLPDASPVDTAVAPSVEEEPVKEAAPVNVPVEPSPPSADSIPISPVTPEAAAEQEKKKRTGWWNKVLG
ncbi:MAG: Rne/Rng family ribonuclease [Proteobacteria bacterium]|nr:Rne/Rng family ribonuclease [Pseudomonadota bacterium]